MKTSAKRGSCNCKFYNMEGGKSHVNKYGLQQRQESDVFIIILIKQMGIEVGEEKEPQ